MKLNESIFREYDIRGVVGKDFDAELAEALGVVLANKVREAFPSESELRVVVGYDCRLSSEELRKALSKGLVMGGVSVTSSGMGPTPQLYYTRYVGKFHGGIQVTGSHNPGDQNGFKMMVGDKTLSGADIQELRAAVFGRKFQPVRDYTPSHESAIDARTPYIAKLVEISKPAMGPRKLKVVVDGGNGVGGLVGPQLLRELGCEVIELFTDPDGTFPNHHPDPTVVENLHFLQKKVLEEKADCGIAWDGDADRIGVVDEKGTPIFGDMLLTIYGRQLLKEFKEPTIIGDVKCSQLLFDDLSKRGAKAVMSKTGHSLIKAKLKELHAELAGEMSGHIFFSHRYFGFDDALHSSARFVEIVSNTVEPVSALLSDLPKVVSTPEMRVDSDDKIKFKVVEKAQVAFSEYEVNTLDGVRIKFANGWGLVRASNTQPVLVMRFEADTEAHLKEYQKIVTDKIEAIKSSLS
jgi:phosphomannomutase/phosphoglucomutase